MRWTRKPSNGWRWRFALLPVVLHDEVIWLEPYQSRWGGDCVEVRTREDIAKAGAA